MTLLQVWHLQIKDSVSSEHGEGRMQYLPHFVVALHSAQTLAPHLPRQRSPGLRRRLVTCHIRQLLVKCQAHWHSD